LKTIIDSKIGLGMFWQKNIGAKAARKMLMKLNTERPRLFTAAFIGWHGQWLLDGSFLLAAGAMEVKFG